MNLDFYRGKRVLITGHTGFKGSWLTKVLTMAGAEVYGFSLPSPTDPALYHLAGLDQLCHSTLGDIRELPALSAAVKAARPAIVFHLAAQPVVRDSYKCPVDTYSTNVMGTAHLLEACRAVPELRSLVNITTDKVYKNHEWPWPYRETDALNGHDPYSNSKSCSELVTNSYRLSFFNQPDSPAISTARAGNVIGGGDFTVDRVIPDCVRSILAGRPMEIRNPSSIRPYQHVLESLSGYLTLAQAQYEQPALASEYNFGPADADCVSTERLVGLFFKHWGSGEYRIVGNQGPHEAQFLKLDCSKAHQTLQWQPRLNISQAMELVVAWTKVYQQALNNTGAAPTAPVTAIGTVMEQHINGYFA
jgi:CDP-glucose 4,6-dehydratase